MFNLIDYFRDRRSLLAIIDEQNRANDELHRQLGEAAESAQFWNAEFLKRGSQLDATQSQLDKVAADHKTLLDQAEARERKLADFRAIVDQCKRDRDAATAQAAELSESNAELAQSVERMAKERDEVKAAAVGELKRLTAERDEAIIERDNIEQCLTKIHGLASDWLRVDGSTS